MENGHSYASYLQADFECIILPFYRTPYSSQQLNDSDGGDDDSHTSMIMGRYNGA